jgi:predicted ester cyclase
MESPRLLRTLGLALSGLSCTGLLAGVALPLKADQLPQRGPQRLTYFNSPSYACGPKSSTKEWYFKGVPYPCPKGLTSENAPFKKNREVYHDIMEKAWVQGDMSVLDKYIVGDSYDYSPLHPPEKGTKGFAGIIGAFRGALSDIKLEHSDMAEGDLVTHFWKLTGVHNKGPLFGAPPNGKTVTLSGISTVQVKDGKVIGRWSQLDIYGLLVQLGAIKKIL